MSTRNYRGFVKLFPSRGSVAVRQLNTIHKKVSSITGRKTEIIAFMFCFFIVITVI